MGVIFSGVDYSFFGTFVLNIAVWISSLFLNTEPIRLVMCYVMKSLSGLLCSKIVCIRTSLIEGHETLITKINNLFRFFSKT